METLRIALAQINATVGDLDGNGRTILESAARAKEAGAHIVTFPELALSGYPPEDLLLRPRFLRDCQKAIEQLARSLPDLIAVVGFPHWLDGKVYNAAAVVLGGSIAHTYHKVDLPNYGVFDEKRYFTPGSGGLVFEAHGVRVSVSICEDIWSRDGQAEQYTREHGVHTVLNISASPFHAGKLAVRREIVAGFARRTGAFLCYNNLVGSQDELIFDGGSLIAGPAGQIIGSARRFEEDLLVADLNAEVKVAGAPPPLLGPVEEVYKALVLGVRDYVRKNGFTKTIVGLSGGVDSALTAAIAAEALGRDNVVAVTMPSHYTSRETLADASLVAANLGVPLITVPIMRIFTTYLEELEEPFGGGGRRDLMVENIQARIRGNILMALSNRFGWLVLTTGNKSETAVGYCTLYGDMAGGFAVIKDVPKTLVYQLARHINRQAGRDLLPQSVLVRPPTAELKPDQKDTDSLPPYPVLDRILKLYVEEDAAVDDIIAAGFSAAVAERVVRMVDRNEYKRRQAPPGIKITPKAFGRDRRLPITNRYWSLPEEDGP